MSQQSNAATTQEPKSWPSRPSFPPPSDTFHISKTSSSYPIKQPNTGTPQYPVLLTSDSYDSNSSALSGFSPLRFEGVFASPTPAASETPDVGTLRPSRPAIADLASLAALRSPSHSEHVSKSSTSSYTVFRKGFHSRRGDKGNRGRDLNGSRSPLSNYGFSYEEGFYYPGESYR